MGAVESVWGSVAVCPTTLFGYEVIERLGQGAGSTIYAVSDPTSRQLYALKHVLRKEERDSRFVEQLQGEFEVARRVDHVGIRKCYDVKFKQTLLRKVTEAALVMELFDGWPLDRTLPEPIVAKVELFMHVADALAALHDAGFVHCDLKPNNILLGAAGEVKVIDLGQTCKIGTIKERIQGTPDFISPEQVMCEAVTPRTDVFNFGATMYWALTGRKMPTLYTLRRSENSFLVDDQLTAPSMINPSVPESLSRLVLDCVRTNPERRVADFVEVKRRLDVVHHSLTHVPDPNADLVYIEDDDGELVAAGQDETWWT